MASVPNVAYVKKQGDPIKIRAPKREIPIVYLPGVMGSRLTNPANNSLVWNPKGEPLNDPGVFTVDLRTLEQTSLELVPDDTHKYGQSSENEKYKHIVNAFQVIHGYYKEMALQLTSWGREDEVDALGLRLKVYCCGYDWRLDNARSALRLAGVVDQAIRETGEEQVIIIGHSMGGLIARYYCRLLGGEKRVKAMILLASPTLGAPEAFLQLKNGNKAAYVQDIIQHGMDGDSANITRDAVGLATNVAKMAGAMVGNANFDQVVGIFDKIYLAMCLGAGRFLSRQETKYFSRQFPALFQLAPNQIYCAQTKAWILFDPLQTGYKPTGHMVVFPTALADMLPDVGDWLGSERSERTSDRANRNMTKVGDMLTKIGEELEKIGKPFSTGEGWGDAAGAVGETAGEVVEILERLEQTFMDCSNPKQLYYDIYTGLLDVPQERALCAANLAMAFRFQEALLINPSSEKSPSAKELAEKAFGAIFNAIAAEFKSAEERRRAEDQERRARARAEAREPKAYVHPVTYNVYSSTEPVDNGCTLIPIDVLSNDDSNLVKSEFVPDFLPAINGIFAAAGISVPVFDEKTILGDGTVPTLSANCEDKVNHPFKRNEMVPQKTHADFCNDSDVIDKVKDILLNDILPMYNPQEPEAASESNESEET
jgi:pimeloyl-ACP methyl ester carboxylesterase